MYTGNQNCQNVDPNARRLTKLEPNEIFNDFVISREPFDEIDRLIENKIQNRLDRIARRFPRLEPNESSSSHILVFKLNNQFNIANLTLVFNMLTRIRNGEILKPIARILPKLHPNEVLAEVVL